MRTFSKAAAAVAAAGLAAFGAVAGGGGAASAATTGQSVTGCDLGSGQLTAGLTPACTAPDSTVNDPTSITVTADPAFFTVLQNQVVGDLLGGTLGEHVTYTLSCSVNGGTATYDGSFTATTDTSTESQTVDLQSAVGSPVPNSCTVTDLKATSLVSLGDELLGVLGDNGLLDDLSFGVSATAGTAVPGAIWMAADKTSSGLDADICADDNSNGNAGAIVQVYQCNSDLAQYWVQSSTGQLVRNGDCITQSGARVFLEKCSGTNAAQKWTVKGTGGKFGRIVGSTGDCLTASSAKNFVQLTATGCNGIAGQAWTGPAPSAA
jgi:Ricin-type beta-trefoil lectin domain